MCVYVHVHSSHAFMCSCATSRVYGPLSSWLCCDTDIWCAVFRVLYFIIITMMSAMLLAQPPRDEELEQLRKEKEDLHQTVLTVYQDAETQLSERDLKWQELLNRTKADGDKMQRQYRETYKKHYTQKYLGWCKAMLSEDSDGQRPPVGSGEEADFVEVVREYQERTTEKLRAMEERYLNDIKAYEEGSKKKMKSPAGDSPAVGVSDFPPTSRVAPTVSMACPTSPCVDSDWLKCAPLFGAF